MGRLQGRREAWPDGNRRQDYLRGFHNCHLHLGHLLQHQMVCFLFNTLATLLKVSHQHYVSGGQIVHISSQPLAVKGIIINMEISQKPAE
ncbi:MAG: hypothetical protein HYT38_01160 [Candidatus Sungbacteria bacterium]|uniref:Uncharacterized protein n=1 Tax=Candidatus Sungiibacteriota bacterium TaxID=2750080 RepID=A0A931YD62_9BACT|nr:hypothetical protein [Candidatus Sungbacteria bacterium]MBI2465743.1 hypothetical protein [Candidatus Sungbacteria bacterium]